MATRISNIQPIDLSARTAVGVSLPFNGPGVFVSTYTTQDQLRTNILNWLLTNKGERLFQPTWGSDIKKFIFENITPVSIENLKSILISQMAVEFPNIELTEFEITVEQENIVNIFFRYRVKQTTIEDEIQVTFNQ